MLGRLTISIGFLCAVAAPALADDPGISFDENGIEINIAGDDLSLTLGGRLHLDSNFFDNGLTVFNDDSGVRRGRLELGGRVLKDWRFRLDREFSSQGRGFKNAWLSYRGIDHVELVGGNFTTPFSLEALTSSNATAGMERSLANALAPNFLLGGSGAVYGKHWSVTGGYFFNSLSQDPTVNRDSGKSIMGRATFAPVNKRHDTVHFGAAIEHRDLDAGVATRVRSFPEASLATARLVDTGNLAGVSSFNAFNFEAALRHRGAMLSGQFIRRNNNAPTLGDPVFNAGYIQGAWVLTGEDRSYSERQGIFGGIEPKSRLGAVELVARYSFLDLNDGPVTGGEEKDYLVGLNWYVIKNLRFMGNYVHAVASPNSAGLHESLNVYEARMQVAF